MSEGIVVGCDNRQEWLLPWWWSHYSAHNKYPVAFVNFGMSHAAWNWCKERGVGIRLDSSDFFQERKVGNEMVNRWNRRAGDGFLYFRSAWFKKPLAFSKSPFEFSCWIDLDCQVKRNLTFLFQCLALGVDLAIARETEEVQNGDENHGLLLPGEISYNSGVVAFRKNSEIINRWIQLSSEKNDQFMGDQNALSRAIYLYKPSMIELPRIYNWKNNHGANPDAALIHYIGVQKLEILKSLHPNLSV